MRVKVYTGRGHRQGFQSAWGTRRSHNQPPARQPLRQTSPAIRNAPAGSTGRVTLTGCRGLLDRVQHPMARDRVVERGAEMRALAVVAGEKADRKSTRLNSSH